MKKGLLALVIIGAAAFIIYKVTKKDDPSTANPETPIAVTPSDSLTLGMQNLVTSYYTLKNAFIKSDLAQVNEQAKKFDTLLTNSNFTGKIQDEALRSLTNDLVAQLKTPAKGIIAGNDLEIKRAYFQTVSDAMFDLLRSVQYRGGKVYQQYCPMAFDNKGAAWLSESADIINPYFGDKMLNCGELRDSINITTP